MKYFTKELLKWYESNHRKLPWRETKDPYKIWVSEIILQQTRVSQGHAYYLRFIKRFPNIASLADAEEEDVLKLWQGLGYYSRARNMHAAAQQIMQDFSGVFPTEHKDILKLKGIGEYTASAISSFAFDQAYPVIDANVKRIISRIFGITTTIESQASKNKIKTILQDKMDVSNIAMFNQAIMEFGALQCVPKTPNCNNCIFKKDCYAYQHKMLDIIPKKKEKRMLKLRYFHYLVILDKNNNTLIHKRTANDIWRHLYEFPLIEGSHKLHVNTIKEKISKYIKTSFEVRSEKDYTHILSHQKIFARFYIIHLEKLEKTDFSSDFPGVKKINTSKITTFPLPKIIEQYIPNILFN